MMDTALYVVIVFLVGLSTALFLRIRRIKDVSNKMIHAAGLISGGVLGERIPVRPKGQTDKLAKTFNSMADQLETTIRRLQEEKRGADSILSTMMEQVIAVDLAGKILFLNPAAEKLFEISNRQAIGKFFLEVVRHPKIANLLRSVLNNRFEQTQFISFILPQEKFFEVRGSMIRGDGKDEGVLLVFYDVTQIQKLEQIRSDFVANVSHELRTPLTSIQGFAETLLSGSVSNQSQVQEFLETIYEQSSRLSRLVNDLLDLSALEHGQRKSDFILVDLTQLLKEVGDALQPLAQKRGIKIDIELPSVCPQVEGHREQIKQVFTNLIDNAVKFNQENGFIRIRVIPKDPDVMVQVEDTGIGIPEKEFPRIFERFYRVDKARSRDLGGTGLGLAIVKHMVENHGGSIRVESKENQGSVFTVVFPKSHTAVTSSH